MLALYRCAGSSAPSATAPGASSSAARIVEEITAWDRDHTAGPARSPIRPARPPVAYPSGTTPPADLPGTVIVKPDIRST